MSVHHHIQYLICIYTSDQHWEVTPVWKSTKTSFSGLFFRYHSERTLCAWCIISICLWHNSDSTPTHHPTIHRPQWPVSQHISWAHALLRQTSYRTPRYSPIRTSPENAGTWYGSWQYFQTNNRLLLDVHFPTYPPDCLRCVGMIRCRQDNNLPHESFVESDSRARMSYHNHPKSRLHSIT